MSTVDNQIIVEESRHSKLGASSSYRWQACPGSIQLTDKLIKEGSLKLSNNPAAAEGTAAHLVLSSCLEDGTDASDMAGMEIKVGHWTFVVDDEMVTYVQECIDWVRNRIAKAKADGFKVKLYVERGLSSVTDEEAFGTSDVIIHIIGDRLIVFDFKYGRGITVEPTSDQNYYYAYLSMENFLKSPDDVKVIESWIGQPRIPHPEGTIRRHTTNSKEVKSWWFNKILPAMEATRAEDAYLAVGEHCRFCPNKGECPALKKETFEFPLGIDPNHLSDDELGDILVKIKAIESLKSSLESEALRRARSGNRIKGYKLVQQRANREWKKKQPMTDPKNPDQMIEVTLEDALFNEFEGEAYSEPKIKSPAQIEKIKGGKEFVSSWAFKPHAGLTLAAESDKRPEVRPALEMARGKVTKLV